MRVHAQLVPSPWGPVTPRRRRWLARWYLRHEAGCVECRRYHDDDLRRELVAEAVRAGAGVPRSLRWMIREVRWTRAQIEVIAREAKRIAEELVAP